MPSYTYPVIPYITSVCEAEKIELAKDMKE